METPPTTPPIEPVMRNIFKLLLQAIIDKEKREGTTAHFSGVEMDLNAITDEDIEMYLRIKENPGYTLPTIAEFNAYRESVSLSNNASRHALVGYLGNVLGGILGQKELEASEAQG